MILVHSFCRQPVGSGFGKAFGWLIILMTLGMSYEVFVRYVLNRPTAWSLDVSFIMYGHPVHDGWRLHAVRAGGHVRGEFPVPALASARAGDGRSRALHLLLLSRRHGAGGDRLEVLRRGPGVYAEVSVNSPAGIPIFQFKSVIGRGRHIGSSSRGIAPGFPMYPVHPGGLLATGARGCRRKPRSCC